MKTRSMLALVAVAALGLMASQAGAIPTMTISIQVDPNSPGYVNSKSATVGTNTQVWMFVYAYVNGADGDYTNDGVRETYGKIMTPGALHGNMAFTAAGSAFYPDTAGFRVSPFNNGTARDLDADGDLDLGGTNQETDTTSWVHPYAGVTCMNPIPTDGNKVYLGRLVFTMASGATGATTIDWSYRVKTGTGSEIDAFAVDALRNTTTNELIVTTVPGTGNAAGALGVDGSPVITFVPEPATMALLAFGGAAVMAIRKRRRA